MHSLVINCNLAVRNSWLFPPPICLLMAQAVKNPPAMQETQEMHVQSLDQEDPLEEGNGNPLQYSCLEDPMDRGAWWATVHGSQRVGHDWAHTESRLFILILDIIPCYHYFAAQIVWIRPMDTLSWLLPNAMRIQASLVLFLLWSWFEPFLPGALVSFIGEGYKETSEK